MDDVSPDLAAFLSALGLCLGLIVSIGAQNAIVLRQGLRRDCRRHTEFAVFGWVSLRYAYEDVMFEQEWVRWTLTAWSDTVAGRAPGRPPRRAR